MINKDKVDYFILFIPTLDEPRLFADCAKLPTATGNHKPENILFLLLLVCSMIVSLSFVKFTYLYQLRYFHTFLISFLSLLRAY